MKTITPVTVKITDAGAVEVEPIVNPATVQSLDEVIFTPKVFAFVPDKSPLEIVESWYVGVLASAPPLTQLGLREHIAAEWPKLVEALS